MVPEKDALDPKRKTEIEINHRITAKGKILTEQTWFAISTATVVVAANSLVGVGYFQFIFYSTVIGILTIYCVYLIVNRNWAGRKLQLEIDSFMINDEEQAKIARDKLERIGRERGISRCLSAGKELSGTFYYVLVIVSIAIITVLNLHSKILHH